VPEAAIDEYGDTRAPEDEVSAAAYTGYDGTVDPVTETAPVELSSKSHLRRGVPSRLALHAAKRGRR
jgi:hypothetical protein